jgi:hypothetical protein
MVKLKGIEEAKMLFSVQCERMAEMRYPPPEGLVVSAAVRSNWQSAVKLMQASKMLQTKAADKSNAMASARMRQHTSPLVRKSGSKGSLNESPSRSADSRAHGGSHSSALGHARRSWSRHSSKDSLVDDPGDSNNLPGAVYDS